MVRGNLTWMDKRLKARHRRDGVSVYEWREKEDGWNAHKVFVYKGVIIAEYIESVSGGCLYVLLGVSDKGVIDRIKSLICEYPGRMLMLEEY